MEEDIFYDYDTIDFLCDSLLQKGLEDGIIMSEEVYDTLGKYDIQMAEDFLKDAKDMDIKIIDSYKDNIGIAECNAESDVGMFLHELKQYPLLTREEEIALAKRKDEGDELAREMLINSNMRLVVSTALKYTNKGVNLEDLIAEGSLGLITACDRYDYTVGKFDTIAFWYIRRNIRFAIAKYGKVVNLPVHLYNKLCNLKKEVYLFSQKNNRQPTIEEMAEITKEDVGLIKTLFEYNQDVVELDAEIQKGSNDSVNSPSEYRKIKDTIIDEKSSEDEIRQNLCDAIIRGMDLLTQRERDIINYHYGLKDNGSLKTLNEVGNKFGLTRERARQIESCAMRKLRHPKNLGELVAL